MQPTTSRRPWTRGEELANTISHGAGALAAMVGAPFLILAALDVGHDRAILASVIFALTTIFLYLSSALHHGLPIGRGKELFEVVDHVAIFLLIAGTYTPLSLGVLWGDPGLTIMVVVWTLAFGGVLLKVLRGTKHLGVTVALYVGMGWLLLLFVEPLSQRLPAPGLTLLVVGGLAYTGGLGFFAARRWRYHHLYWHLCVLAGTTCHYFAVLWYVY